MLNCVSRVKFAPCVCFAPYLAVVCGIRVWKSICSRRLLIAPISQEEYGIERVIRDPNGDFRGPSP